MDYGIKVTLLNPETVENLYSNHGQFAAVCYGGTPYDSIEDLTRIGRGCNIGGHMSGSRCEYIKFEIIADRGTLEQCLRSEIGCRQDPTDIYLYEDLLDLCPRVSPDEVVKNMASFRYIDKDGFGFTTPANIQKYEEISNIYTDLMKTIDDTRRVIKEKLVEAGVDPHKAVEDANLTLPRATLSRTVIGFTPEALIRFENMRLCTRAQEFIHQIAVEIKRIITEVNPKFANELKPNCQRLLWCPEHKGCGAYPKKKELKEMIEAASANKQV